MALKRGAISAMTIALKTTGPRRSASASSALDQLNQSGSRVNTSSSTLESTTVPGRELTDA